MIRVEYLGLAFGASEIVVAWRRRAARVGAESRDRGTLGRVWAVLAASGLAVGWILARVTWGRFRPGAAGELLALGLLLSGVALRWWAILTLGRFFTVDVALHEGHRLVSSGPYRWLRHPSYTGVLVALAGLGLATGSGPALAAMIVPLALVLCERIRVEERVLAQRFGEEWTRHCARTWRLVPGVW